MNETNERQRAIRHKWTDEEVEFIINYWETKPDKWMAKKLGVTVRQYSYERRMLGFTKQGKFVKGKRRSWTFEEEQVLRRLYPEHSSCEIGEILGKNPQCVRWKARKIGLRKAYNPGSAGFQRLDNSTYVMET